MNKKVRLSLTIDRELYEKYREHLDKHNLQTWGRFSQITQRAEKILEAGMRFSITIKPEE